MRIFLGLTMLASTFAAQPSLASDYRHVDITGERQVWRTVTIDLGGVHSSETATPNPFTDYRLDIVFSHEGARYIVPGYFAACGEAALNSCTEGAVWRVHFTPDAPGEWTYEVRFRQGENIILGGEGTAIDGLDGITGSFAVAPVPQGSTDSRDRGRLVHDETRYLHFAETGDLFFKAGADAPENTLAFTDFDATPNRNGLRKDWALHLGDAEAADISQYGWNGRGGGLIGAWSYLDALGINAVSFLTFSLGGDDQNVFPHLMRVSQPEYEAMEPAIQWSAGVHHTRFDVSKMDQWGRVFSFANDRGLFLHFKLQELENDTFMDGGDVGIERMAYLRQIIARYGHHLALNWNAGEENTQSAEQEIASLAAIAALDPYDHPRVSHSYPGRKVRYFPLLGDRSEVTGASIQGMFADFRDVRPEIAEWVLRSAAAGTPWAVASDEQGGGEAGIPVDQAYPDALLPTARQFADNRLAVRGQVAWGTLTAGGYGFEYYGGYGSGCGDLQCQDFRARETKWRDAATAVRFFSEHIGQRAYQMEPLDMHSGTSEPFWFGDGDRFFLVYAHDGKSIARRGMVPASQYRVSWYDPVTGELAGERVQQTRMRSNWIDLCDLLETGESPGTIQQDWVLLIEHISDAGSGSREDHSPAC